MVKVFKTQKQTRKTRMSLTSLTNEDRIIILAGLLEVVSSFHEQLLAKLPPSLPMPDQTHPPTKKTMLPLPTLVALVLFRFFTWHRSWKDYYLHLKTYHQDDLGQLPNYKNFMRSVHNLTGYGLMFLEVLRKWCKQGVEVQFADSTKLEACKIKREFSHQVAKGVASKSKGTMGWWYGFKLHLVCDSLGRILAWRITTAAFDDRKGLALIWEELTGMIVADAGYVGANWQQAAADLGLRLMAAARKIMKKIMTKAQHQLLIARQRVETTYSVLKLRLGLETTLPRSVMGYLVHYIWCLLAYQLRRLSQLENKALLEGQSA
jgi:transposase